MAVKGVIADAGEGKCNCAQKGREGKQTHEDESAIFWHALHPAR